MSVGAGEFSGDGVTVASGVGVTDISGTGVEAGVGVGVAEINCFAFFTAKAIQLNRISSGAGLFNLIVKPFVVFFETRY